MKIFINYRRDRDKSFAGRLNDRLQMKLPGAELFYDVDTIPPGADFPLVIDQWLRECDVLLAVIGTDWVAELNRRRNNPAVDYVVSEIATALRDGKLVVPVLFDNAAMAPEADLPPQLRPLVRRNAVPITHHRFTSDVDELAQELASALGPATAPGPAAAARPSWRSAWSLAATVVVALVLAVGGFWVFTSRGAGDHKPLAAAPIPTTVAPVMAVAPPVPAEVVALPAPAAPTEAMRRNAEAAETAQQLQEVDRQRVQIALTSLGYDTRGSGGVWDARTREMIGDWQRATQHPATRFLTADQMQALLGQASFAINRFDEALRAKAAADKEKAAAAEREKVAAEKAAADKAAADREQQRAREAAATKPAQETAKAVSIAGPETRSPDPASRPTLKTELVWLYGTEARTLCGEPRLSVVRSTRVPSPTGWSLYSTDILSSFGVKPLALNQSIKIGDSCEITLKEIGSDPLTFMFEQRFSK